MGLAAFYSNGLLFVALNRRKFGKFHGGEDIENIFRVVIDFYEVFVIAHQINKPRISGVSNQ